MSTFDTDGQDEGNSNEYQPEPKSMTSTDITVTAQSAIYKAESHLIDSIQDASTAAMALDAIGCIESRLKQAKKAITERVIEWGKGNKIHKAEIGGGKVLVFGTDKTNKFDTQAIYKALEVPQYLQDILPANPKFSVTAVRQNEKIAHLTWEESKDTAKVSIVDKQFIAGGTK